LRALFASQGVTVHAVVLGPVDTDMNRGFEIPKAAPKTAAAGIFDGLEKDEEEIFPDRFRTRSRKDGEMAYRRRLKVSSRHSCL